MGGRFGPPTGRGLTSFARADPGFLSEEGAKRWMDICGIGIGGF